MRSKKKPNHEILVPIMFLLPILFFSSFAYAVDIPYEKCTWQNKAFTERLVNEAQDFRTEADCPNMNCAQNNPNTVSTDDSTFKSPVEEAISKNIPPECFFASAVRSVEKKPGYIPDKEKPQASTNYYYCDSMSSKQAKKFAPTISSKGNKKNIFPQPPCLNEDYIMMTYNSFHNMADCFGFNGEDKKDMFKLFNHESKFILNQKSPTGAKCYGQLVRNTLEEVNKRIYISSVSTHPKSQIYKNFRDKCPDLLNQVRIPDKVLSGSRSKRSSDKKFKSDHDGIKKASRSMDCAVTQNADTCFFYSMYNMKLNQNQLEKALRVIDEKYSRPIPQKVETDSDTPASQRIRKAIEDFQMPLKLNEMLIVRGPITKEGVTKNKNWLMRSDEEIYDALFDDNGNRKAKYNINDLEIQKVTVFDMEDKETQRNLLYQAYNQGISALDDERMADFIEDEKRHMSNGKYCRENTTMLNCQKICKESPESENCNDCHQQNRKFLACQNRKKIMAGQQKLAFDVENFGRVRKFREQAILFPAQIRRDKNYLNDTSTEEQNPKPLTNHLTQLAKRGPKAPPDDNKTEEFVNFVKDKCVF